MFDGMSELFKNPHFIKFIVSYCAFMAFTSALPSPEKASAYIKGGWLLLYSIVFAFFHALSVNFSRAAVAFKMPGAKEESA